MFMFKYVKGQLPSIVYGIYTVQNIFNFQSGRQVNFSANIVFEDKNKNGLHLYAGSIFLEWSVGNNVMK